MTQAPFGEIPLKIRGPAAVAIALLLALLIGLILRKRAEPRADPEAPRAAAEKAASPKGAPRDAEAGPAPEGAREEPEKPPALRRISGRLLHADRTGAERCGLALTLAWTMGVPPVHYAASGAEGAFAFPGVAPGEYRVTAAFDAVSVPVEVGAADVEGLELVLPASAAVLATVVDARGAAVAGARVALPYSPGDSAGTTDELGRVRLTAVGDHVFVAVTAAPPGDRRYLLPPEVELRPGQREVRLVLADAALATGVVLTPRGLPTSLLLHTVRDHAILASTTSDGDGHFEASVPLDGTASLVIDVGGGALAIREEEETEFTRVTGRLDGVRAGDRDLRLRLVAVPRDRALSVRVESPAGKPVAGARVELIEDAGSLAVEETDAVGVAHFEKLYDTLLLVDVTRPADDPAAADWLTGRVHRVTPAGQEVVVRLREGVRLRGVILLPDGEPCIGAHVCPTIKRADCPLTTVGEDGAFGFLLDPDDQDRLDFQAWAEIRSVKYSGGLRRVDPRAGSVTIRLIRDP